MSKTSSLMFMLTLTLVATPLFAEAKKPVVLTAKITKTELSNEMTYPARLSSQINAGILSDIDGVVTEILKPIGSSVQVGTPIASVKNTNPVYEYVPVVIKSNVSGVVSAQEISVGSMVQRGQVIAVVTDPSKLILKLEVTSRDLPLIRVGMIGEFSLYPSPAGTCVPFKVSGVSPVVDPATGTATVEMRSANAEAKKLPLGMLGKISFKINQRQGIVVSDDALVYRGSDVFVRTVVGSVAKYAKVKIASTLKGQAEIASGLNEGDVVITRSSVFIADGQEVTVEAGDVAKK